MSYTDRMQQQKTTVWNVDAEQNICCSVEYIQIHTQGQLFMKRRRSKLCYVGKKRFHYFARKTNESDDAALRKNCGDVSALFRTPCRNIRCVSKNAPTFYILNNSPKNEQILIIFGV